MSSNSSGVWTCWFMHEDWSSVLQALLKLFLFTLNKRFSYRLFVLHYTLYAYIFSLLCACISPTTSPTSSWVTYPQTITWLFTSKLSDVSRTSMFVGVRSISPHLYPFQPIHSFPISSTPTYSLLHPRRPCPLKCAN